MISCVVTFLDQPQRANQQKTPIARFLIATHPKTEIAVTLRKQSTAILSNRNTLGGPAEIPRFLSRGLTIQRGEGNNTPWGYCEMTSRNSKSIAPAARGSEAHPKGRKAAGVDPEIKAANLRRLRRIEGQIRGLARMVEENRYCPDILVQISSVQEALRAVGRGLMRNHLQHCATEAIRKGSPAEAEATYDELMNLIYTHAR